MKRQILQIAGVLALLMVAGSAYAQSVNLKATVPFNFAIEGRTLPAGNYSIQSMDSASGRVLLVRGDQKDSTSLIMTHAVEARQASKQTKLVFRQYGTRYFLSQVWMEGDASGHEFKQSPREKEVALDYPSHEVVLVASAR